MKKALSQPPVYIHSIHIRGTREYLYYRNTYESEPDQEFIDFRERSREITIEELERIRSCQTASEMNKALKSPEPEEFNWIFKISKLLPWNPKNNDFYWDARIKADAERRNFYGL